MKRPEQFWTQRRPEEAKAAAACTAGAGRRHARELPELGAALKGRRERCKFQKIKRIQRKRSKRDERKANMLSLFRRLRKRDELHVEQWLRWLSSRLDYIKGGLIMRRTA